jgi:hypothetical protein
VSPDLLPRSGKNDPSGDKQVRRTGLIFYE